MDTEPQSVKYPLFSESIVYIISKFPFYKRTSDYIAGNFDEIYYTFAEKICSLLLSKVGSKEKYFKSLDSLIRISANYLKLQLYLVKTGHYLHQNFAEVNNAVYQNEFMESEYLDSLFLSQVFWPNHFKLLEYFHQFCDLLSEHNEGMEVPCGAGVFSFVLLGNKSVKTLDLFDISSYSLGYTNKILDLSGKKCAGVNLKKVDLFELKGKNKYDFIICGELIEHLEDPKTALKILDNLLKPKGVLFLTTAIYAAALDHIYLFENVNDVRTLIFETGFSIHSELALPLSLKEYKEEMNKEPINYACILKKRPDFLTL